MLKTTLTAAEAAEYLGTSYWNLLQMAKKGLIPHIRIGRRVLFRQESLETWLANQESHSLQRPGQLADKGTLRKIY